MSYRRGIKRPTGVTHRLASAVVFGLCVASSAAGTPKTDRIAQERRADLDALERQYVDRAPAFTPAARTHARQLVASAKKDAAHLSNTAFFLRVARIIALADNGHDSIDPGDSKLLPAVTLPVRLVWMGDDLVVTRAQQRYADLVGARIERIGTVTPAKLYRRYREYQGGNEPYRRVNMMWLIHNPAVLAAMGVIADTQHIPVSIELASGQHETRVLGAIADNEAPHLAYPAGWWSTQASAAETSAGWVSLNAPPPLYLQQPERYFRMVDLPQLDGLYVQFRVNVSEADQPIEPFVAEVSKRVDGKRRNLILDLRFDTGGDITTTLALMRRIGRSVPGRIFVITSPYTFSAGIASEAAVLQAGGRKVTVIGDSPGDRTYWWSERKPFCLPHSKVCAPLQLGYWDLVHGCRGKPDCYGDQFGIRVARIEPDLRVITSVVQWRKGEDPDLSAIAAAVGKDRLADSNNTH